MDNRTKDTKEKHAAATQLQLVVLTGLAARTQAVAGARTRAAVAIVAHNFTSMVTTTQHLITHLQKNVHFSLKIWEKNA